jgi:rhodanese-related sulfurtransferase
MGHEIGTREAKDALFDGFARVAASLSSGRRLEIVDVLAQAPRSVEDLSAVIGQSVANTSHHLRRLAEDGLVESDKRGRRVVYRLSSHGVYELWRALQEVAATHHGGMHDLAIDYVGDRNDIEVVGRDALRARIERGDDIVIIDVRPRVEYEAGHLEGAIHVPPDDIEDAVDRLPADGEVIAYCRGASCAYADRAIRALRERGRAASRLTGGYLDWSVSD